MAIATPDAAPTTLPSVPPRSRGRVLFTLTVFVGSFLLFQVQPMVARIALPDLGGAPAVWNSAMLVYQALLLAGYAWAHWLTRFPVRRQAVLHLLLLTAGFLWLPVGLVGWEPPTGDLVVLFVPLLLLVSVGPVILAVSAQAPMMQTWFAAGNRSNPYWLYAASNLGSFMGLLAYPLVVEPSLGLSTQRWAWAAGYVALVLLVAVCGRLAYRSAEVAGEALERTAVPRATDGEQAHAEGPPTRTQVAWWLALSAVPSGLMLSTTTHISTDIMAMPLLWAIPLGLYLLSFTVAFAERRALARLLTRVAPVLLLVIASFALLGKGLPGYPVAALSLVTLFVVAVALHSRLYDTRPPPAQLTRFYLTTSVGGALGGIFCGLIAPLAFDWVYEHPILVVAAAALIPLSGRVRARTEGAGTLGRRLVYVTSVVVLMLALGGPSTLSASFDGSRERSYFGVYTVTDVADGQRRELVHGGTVHGMQLLGPGEQDTPTMYYGEGSGVGLVLTEAESLFGSDASVGVVGLGAGTLACYGRPGQSWRFFEIDPLMVRIARDPSRFTFLSDCAPDAEITEGDARLELGKVPADSYDVLVVDAFSSDAIPMHLMTREAFGTYDDVVRDGGLVLVHITNRFIDLEPVLAALVRDAGWTAAVRDDEPSTEEIQGQGTTSSRWVVLSREPGVLADRMALVGGDWRDLDAHGTPRAWTDDHASVLPLFR